MSHLLHLAFFYLYFCYLLLKMYCEIYLGFSGEWGGLTDDVEV